MRCQLIFTSPATHDDAPISYEEQRALAAELRSYGVEIDDVVLVSNPDGTAADSPWVNRVGADLAFTLRPPLDVEGLLNYVAATGRAVTFVSRPDWEATPDTSEPITHVAYITSSDW